MRRSGVSRCEEGCGRQSSPGRPAAGRRLGGEMTLRYEERRRSEEVCRRSLLALGDLDEERKMVNV